MAADAALRDEKYTRMTMSFNDICVGD